MGTMTLEESLWIDDMHANEFLRQVYLEEALYELKQRKKEAKKEKQEREEHGEDGKERRNKKPFNRKTKRKL